MDGLGILSHREIRLCIFYEWESACVDVLNGVMEYVLRNCRTLYVNNTLQAASWIKVARLEKDDIAKYQVGTELRIVTYRGVNELTIYDMTVTDDCHVILNEASYSVNDPCCNRGVITIPTIKVNDVCVTHNMFDYVDSSIWSYHHAHKDILPTPRCNVTYRRTCPVTSGYQGRCGTVGSTD